MNVNRDMKLYAGHGGKDHALHITIRNGDKRLT